jgi:hypothetical protein
MTVSDSSDGCSSWSIIEQGKFSKSVPGVVGPQILLSGFPFLQVKLNLEAYEDFGASK